MKITDKRHGVVSFYIDTPGNEVWIIPPSALVGSDAGYINIDAAKCEIHKFDEIGRSFNVPAGCRIRATAGTSYVSFGTPDAAADVEHSSNTYGVINAGDNALEIKVTRPIAPGDMWYYVGV